jgi:tetratricopeptide (TPR) repeat protein
MNRGVDCAEKGKHEKALRLLNRSIALDSTNFDAVLDRGSVYNDLAMYQEARKDYLYLLKRSYNQADLYYNMGKNYNEMGILDSSILFYDRALALDSSDADHYIGKGNSLADSGLFREAIVQYEKALKITPEDALAFNNMGFAYHDLGEEDQAMRCFLKAIEKGTREWLTYFYMAGILAGKKDYSNACRYYFQAKKNIPLGDTIAPIEGLKCFDPMDFEK